jgi:hypothetical protein
MKKLVLALLILSGCSTPLVTMQKDDIVVSCGGGTVGSILGGYTGYSIQKSHDRDCVREHQEQGYKIVPLSQ